MELHIKIRIISVARQGQAMIEISRYILATMVAQTHLRPLGGGLDWQYCGVRLLHVERIPDDVHPQ